MVLSQPCGRRIQLRGLRSLVLAVYVVLVATLPLLHHDLACHIQSPSHCTTCLVGSAERTPDTHSLSAAGLALIGTLNIEVQRWRAPILSGENSGRAPPAIS